VPIIIGATIVTLTGRYLLRHEAFRRAPPRPAPDANGARQ